MSEQEECSSDPSVSKTKYYYAGCGSTNNQEYIPQANNTIRPNTITNSSTNTYSNNSTTTYDGGSELMPPNGRKTTTTTTTTNTKPLTPQEIQQQQQFSQQAEQQRQIYEQQIKLQQQNEIQRQQQLAEQQRKLQEQQQRQAIIDQYNEAQMQKSISNIQNTPINTFEVGKLEIKNVKRQPASGTGVDKGSVSSISGLDKIEVEFPELANKNDDPGFSHAKPFPSTEKMIILLRNAIDWQHPETGGKMDFDLTIDEKGNVIGVSLLSEPRKKELEDKVSSHILRNPLVFYHTAAERNGKQVRDNISYSVVYSSSAELDKEKMLKWQSEEKKRNPRTVPLDNGQDYELKDNEELIETKNVTPLRSFSKEVILAKINELKNLPGDTYKKIKGFFDLEFLNNADLTNEKNNIKDTPTPSYSSDRLTIVNGVLHSVRRVNNKMSILTPIEK